MNTSIRRFTVLLLSWGLLVAAIASTRILPTLPRLAVPLIVATLTASLTLAAFRVRWLREAVRAIGVRGILAAHIVRFTGFYFIWLYTQGRMPVEFAYRAGWGDIVAAIGAVALLLWRRGPWFWRALTAWNIIGLADLVLAVGTGSWLSATRPGSMIEIVTLPLALVPLWFVPVLLSSHLVLFHWILVQRRSGAAVAESKTSFGRKSQVT
jgi:hypothetical protein